MIVVYIINKWVFICELTSLVYNNYTHIVITFGASHNLAKQALQLLTWQKMQRHKWWILSNTLVCPYYMNALSLKLLTTMVFLCKSLTPLGHLSRQSYGEWVHALLNQVAYNDHNCYRNGKKGEKCIDHVVTRIYAWVETT